MKWFSLGYILFVVAICVLYGFDKNTYAGEQFADRIMLIIPATLLLAFIWGVYLFWRFIR